jgi:S1-C subfamily serine protease
VRPALIRFVALVALVAGVSPQRQARSQPVVEASVVRLTVDTGMLHPHVAAGWAGPCGFVVTAAHALERARAVTVTDASGDEATATVVAVDHRTDLALLDAAALRLVPLELDEPRAGTGWAVVSRDGRLDVLAAIVEPVVVIIRDYTGRHRRAGVELDRALVQGDSGAPVVGADGDVVGVVFATARARAYATSASEVAAFVARTRPECARSGEVT